MAKKHYTPVKIVGLILFLFFTVTVANAADDGKKVFTEMKCSKCHAPQKDQKNGPSLQHIASVYGFGGANALFQYFADDVVPIVAPNHAQPMETARQKIQERTETEQKALSNYIMGFL
jgi:cytochrome c551/c552